MRIVPVVDCLLFLQQHEASLADGTMYVMTVDTVHMAQATLRGGPVTLTCVCCLRLTSCPTGHILTTSPQL